VRGTSTGLAISWLIGTSEIANGRTESTCVSYAFAPLVEVIGAIGVLLVEFLTIEFTEHCDVRDTNRPSLTLMGPHPPWLDLRDLRGCVDCVRDLD
jgi:hypothetical protein